MPRTLSLWFAQLQCWLLAVAFGVGAVYFAAQFIVMGIERAYQIRVFSLIWRREQGFYQSLGVYPPSVLGMSIGMILTLVSIIGCTFMSWFFAKIARCDG